MIRFVCSWILGVALVVTTGGCASGPPYSETMAKAPALSKGNGRLFFFREGSYGWAIQPDVTLNDQTVGKSVPNGFFYVDRPAGNYLVSCHSEGVQTLALSLSEGETRYVRTVIFTGLGIGHVAPLLESEKAATDALKDSRYTGK